MLRGRRKDLPLRRLTQSPSSDLEMLPHHRRAPCLPLQLPRRLLCWLLLPLWLFRPHPLQPLSFSPQLQRTRILLEKAPTLFLVGTIWRELGSIPGYSPTSECPRSDQNSESLARRLLPPLPRSEILILTSRTRSPSSASRSFAVARIWMSTGPQRGCAPRRLPIGLAPY